MKPDQEKVKSLLTDTVTLLCKNGLLFRKELKVQGVLGITLDNDDVFIVHINEIVAENCAAELTRCNDSDTGSANENIGSISTNFMSDRVQVPTDSIPHSHLPPPHYLPKDAQTLSANNFSVKRRRKERFLSRRFFSDLSDASELSSFKRENLKDLQSDKKKKYEDSVVFNRKPEGMSFSTKKKRKDRTIEDEARNDEAIPADEILSDFELIKTDSNAEQMGLNLSVKEERLNADEKGSDADNVVTATTTTTGLKKVEPEQQRRNEIYSVDVQSSQNESIQKWFSQFMPLDAADVLDVSTNGNNNNNNNQLKVKWTDDGGGGGGSVSCGETAPMKVTNVPLVTDLITSARSRRPYQSTSVRRVYDSSVDPLLLSLPIDLPDKHDHLSYENSHLEMAGPSPRRPRSSVFKPYVCQMSGCHRMFFRGSELYRHQREKHGAQHIRPRGSLITFLDAPF